MKNVFVVTFCLGLLLSPSLASGATWYVRPDGSDANAGTGSSPAEAFANLQAACNVAQAGDTVYVAPGDYVGDKIAPTYSGTSSARLNLLGDPQAEQFGDLMPGRVTLTSAGMEIFRFHSIDYLTISNFTFTGGSQLVLNIGGDHMEITDNEFVDCRVGGILSYANESCDDWLIANNYFHGGGNGPSYGSAAIRAYKGGPNDWTIVNNIIDDFDGYGIYRWDRDVPTQVSGITIVNNTITGCTGDEIYISDRTDTVVLRNNIVDGTVATEVAIDEDYNCITGATIGFSAGPNTTRDDPGLTGMYFPTSTSAINGGDDASIILNTDYLGETRIKYGRVDLGAIEAPGMLGDADLDWSVGQSDLDILLSNYELAGSHEWTDGDFDYDGDVDIADLNLLLSHFGQTYAPSAAPEPATLSLLSLGGMILIRRRT